MQILWQDLRYALRLLARSPGFTVVAVLTLGLGIGATTTVFSVLYSMILHPFEARNSNRLVVVSVHYPGEGPNDPGFDYWIPDFLSYRTENHTFEDMVGSHLTDVFYSDGRGTRQIAGAYVTPNAFEFYGVPALLGRGLVRRDGRPGAAPVFVISYRLWRNRFNGDRGVLEKSFRLNNQFRTLVGVMPPRFEARGIMPPGSQGSGVDIWLPITLEPGVTRAAVGPDGSPHFLLYSVGRLKRGVTPRTAAADLNAIAYRLDLAAYPRDKKMLAYAERFTVQVQWDADYLMGSFRWVLYAVFGAVLILLLIACSNVANLLLVRASAREKEITVRAALGASRARLLWQMLVESLVLGAAACAVGCLFAYFGLQALVAIIPQTKLSGETVIGLNPTILFFSVCVALLTALLCGLAPVVYALRTDLRSGLSGSGSRGAGGSFRHGKVRASLVVIEVQLSVVLLVSAGLMMRTFFALSHVNLGFDPRNVLVMELHLPPGRYDTAAKAKEYYREILRRVSAVPGVVSAAEDSSLEWSSAANSEISFPGLVSSGPTHAIFDRCSAGLFRTLELRVLRGRLLSPEDIDQERSVIVINKAAAQGFLRRHKDPVGETVRFDPGDQTPRGRPRVFRIVGVVADIPNRGVQYPAAPEGYLPYTIAPASQGTILVRTSTSADALVPAIAREIWGVDRDVSLANAGSLNKYLYQSSYAQPAFGLATLSGLGALGLALIVIGIFSVMAYTVSRQTHDISVRMVLGAQRSTILKMVLAEGAYLIAAGIGIGVVASYAFTRLLSSQFWGVSPTDPWTFASVAAIVALVGFVACLVPARRAMRVDPIVALRYE